MVAGPDASRSSGDSSGLIVHLLEYQVETGRDAEVDAFLRHSALVTPPAPGVVSRCVGRRLGQIGHEHVAATAWTDMDSFRRGTATNGIPEYLTPVAERFRDVRSTRYRVVHAQGPGCETARILRIYHATVATELLATWERRASTPIERLSTKPGFRQAFAGVGVLDVDPPGETSIIAITAWLDWESVIEATGGHIDRLLLETEMADLERPSDVEHYQLIQASEPPAV
jgi:hypothetical protein